MTLVPHRITFLANASDEDSRQQMEPLDIQGFTYEPRRGLLTDLTEVFGDCGGWMLERKNLSPSNVEFRVEIQLRAVLDLYAALIATGLELTRSGHQVLTSLCTRRRHSCNTAELGQIVVLRLEIAFLDNVTLQSLLTSSCGLA